MYFLYFIIPVAFLVSLDTYWSNYETYVGLHSQTIIIFNKSHDEVIIYIQ